MKKYIIVLLILILNMSNSLAQNFNKELLKSYTTQELNGFAKSKITILEYALENSCYFTPVPEVKKIDFPEIEVKNQTVKFTDLGLKIKDHTQYFIVKNQNKLLVVKSMYILDLEIKNKKK